MSKLALQRPPLWLSLLQLKPDNRISFSVCKTPPAFSLGRFLFALGDSYLSNRLKRTCVKPIDNWCEMDIYVAQSVLAGDASKRFESLIRTLRG